MIKINLLPLRQIKQRIRTKNEVIALGAALVTIALIVLFVGYGQSSRITKLKAKTAVLQQEKLKYQAVIKRIKKIERDKLGLETKLKVIKKLQVTSQIPVRLLDEIAQLTPSTRMWLKSLSLNTHSINLSGVALDNATVALFMEHISKSPYFTSAVLKSSSLMKVSNQKLKSFSLTIGVRQPSVGGEVNKK